MTNNLELISLRKSRQPPHYNPDDRPVPLAGPSLFFYEDRVGYFLKVQISRQDLRASAPGRRQDQAVSETGPQTMLQSGSLNRDLLAHG